MMSEQVELTRELTRSKTERSMYGVVADLIQVSSIIQEDLLLSFTSIRLPASQPLSLSISLSGWLACLPL